MTEPAVLDGPRGPPPSRAPVLGLGPTLAFVLVLAGLFTLGGIPLQMLLGETALPLAQVLLLLLPSLLFIRLGGFDPVRTLSLRWPTRGQVAGGVIVLVGGVQLAWFLAWAQSFVVPVPVEYLETMATALRADSLGRFLWILLVAALVPAVVEEVVFRGIVLSGFRAALPTMWAVLGAGILFGAFHLSPETAFRFVPTAWLGVVLGGIVVATGSLPLSMLLHGVNNALILAVTSVSVSGDRFGEAQAEPPLAILPLALLLSFWGIRILSRERRAQRPSSAEPAAAPGP